jgi:hypothetical protein
MNDLGSMVGLSIGAQGQNCINAIQSYHWPYQNCHTQYINAHSDIAIDKVENGYVVTIAGKKYIAPKAESIASLIHQLVEKKK